MHRKSFNTGWTVSTISGFAAMFDRSHQPQQVTLPHDGMISKNRNSDNKTGSDNGFFPGGAFTYVKKYSMPAEDAGKKHILEFEGAYMHAAVYINGDLAGHCPHGYTTFHVDAGRYLVPGSENEIKVVTKSSNDKDSRWYSGGGLYREAALLIGDPLHIAVDGVRISTPQIEADLAAVDVATTVEYTGPVTRKAWLQADLYDADGQLTGSDRVPLTAFSGEKVTVKQRIFVRQPRLWSVESPVLYTCKVSLGDDQQTTDSENISFGIRRLQLDPQHGLRINGQTVNLRGGCIHHDNGVLGACAFAQAEERRVRILKEAGYNAIRSAHNPVSKAMLDACDRLGMLVMDEVNDTWTQNKIDFDSGLFFADWWQTIVTEMVAKDFNHPSVILYSIGNEIPEVTRPGGAALNRQLADKIRSLDSTRYITNGLNVLLAMSDRTEEIVAQLAATDPAVAQMLQNRPSQSLDAGGDINAMMATFGLVMEKGGRLPMVGAAVEEAASALDVVGYNYLESRYELDGELYPNRIIVGSETYINRIDRNWRLIKDNNHVIGDFCWTAWDYLGEAGIGRVSYDSSRGEGIYGPYPWYIAWCGAIDILGNRRPASYYQEIVWGLRQEPYIAVLRPEHFGRKFQATTWSWSDTVGSWSWPGHDGQPIQVEVYADADEVELILNGNSLGRRPSGEENRFKAVFDTVYQPGELQAIAYKDGQMIGRQTLQSAGDDLTLLADCDRMQLTAGENDLAYLMITLADGQGNLQTGRDRLVKVTVEGAATLQGFGSADPVSLENFFDSERTTFDGKVLAVIRSAAQAGPVTVRISADGCKDVTLHLETIN